MGMTKNFIGGSINNEENNKYSSYYNDFVDH